MAKRATLDERIDAISKARRGSLTPESTEVLRVGLKDSHGVIVERAAVAAQELHDLALIPEVAAAFDRFIDDPGQDKSCVTTTALAEALAMLGATDEARYLHGLRLKRIQMMPGPVDVAAGVRCACALGLVAMGYKHALWEMAALLHDTEPRCRVAAARSIGVVGSPAGVPLLRYKALAGDRDPDVIAECFTSLVELDPANAIPFVGRYLTDPHEAVAESAAIALGTSRRAEAMPLLTAQLSPRTDAQFRRVLLLSIGLMRSAAAIDFLVAFLSDKDSRSGVDAIAALALYKQDASVKQRVAGVVESRKDRSLADAFRAEFG